MVIQDMGFRQVVSNGCLQVSDVDCGFGSSIDEGLRLDLIFMF